MRFSSLLFLLATATVLLVIIGFTLPALAQATACNTIDAMARGLTGPRYQEVLETIGFLQNGTRVEYYANDDTGTWTILLTVVKNNRSCVAATGQHHQHIPKGKPI